MNITHSFRKLLIISLAFFISTSIWAQSIQGVVIEKNSEEFAIAHIQLLGTKELHFYTSIDGVFEFPNLPKGTYQIKINSMGFNEYLSEPLIINNNEHITLNIYLEQSSKNLSEVSILSTRIRNSQASVLEEIQMATEIISGISQEQIKISQDGNAAQAMSRVPGITVVDGKFVMVRGIPERYNQVLLNNAIAPSTEVDKRTFSFDLIPSNVLDKMMIYKSGAPENTGDFAGGLIKVYTAHSPEENQTQIGISTGWNSLTTGKDFFQSQGSATDFLGFDNGFRQLPNGFPTENLRNLPNQSPIKAEAAHLLPNNFASNRSTAIPDLGAQLQLDRIFYIGNTRISTINSIQYSQSQRSYENNFNRYLEMDPETGQTSPRFAYIDHHYEKENKLGALSNWLFQWNPDNYISFKNLFNQIGTNNTVIRTGDDFIQQAGLARANYMYQYRSRSIYSGQLSGFHNFKKSTWLKHINWNLGYNYLGEDQPDLRRFRTIETEEGSNEFRMILPPSSNLYDAGRYYGHLSEWGGNHSLNLSIQPDQWTKSNIKPSIKVGYMLDYRSRNFDTRYFSYFYPGGSSFDVLQDLEKQALDQIFSNENIKTDNGFLLEEGTRNSDSYTAQNLLAAGYTGLVLPINHWTFSGGLRIEYNSLKLQSANDAGQDILVNYPVLSPLLFLNTDYEWNARNKIRFAYYKSVNRPEFREVAPFLFYDYEFDAEKYGNPDLVTAKIDNLDLRYEFYPRAGESLSIGAFYKHFTNPIETQILIRSESPAFSYQNAHSAYNGGIEIEFRKALDQWLDYKFFRNLSLNLNASYIISEVDYGTQASEGQEAKRALQGQSPYVFNGILAYNNESIGLQSTIAYNLFGPRIYAVGSVLFPTIYELPRHSFDFTIQKTLKNNWSIKFGVQDILNATYKFYQDSDRDGTINIDGKDDPIFLYQKGSTFQLSLNYKF